MKSAKSDLPRIAFAVSPEMFNIGAVVLMLSLYNHTMFDRVAGLAHGTYGLFLFAVMAFAANLTVVTLCTILFAQSLQKIVVGALLILSAVTSYFTDRMGAAYDADLVSAVIGTSLRETAWLADGDLLRHVLIWGVAPAIAVAFVPLKKRSPVRNGLTWPMVILAAYATALGARELIRPEFRNLPHRDLAAVTYTLQPASFLSAAGSVLADQIQTIGQPFTQIGLDARKGPVISSARKPVVVFLVVGESARAENYQINGYARKTNPLLSALDIINLGRATSCATSTRPSVRCLFSKFDHTEFTYAKFATHENLVDVIQHAGIAVDWFNNNFSPTGAGVALRIKVTTLSDNLDQPGCAQKECVDSVFFAPVSRVIAETAQDTLVVLHLAGSHFPYADRYPDGFDVFKPSCAPQIYQECTRQEIINAYDNSILYNDYVLATIIAMLADQDRIIPALLYVSDHGESLGENGVYAHSRPVKSAPPEQFSVPFLLWMAQSYKALFAVDARCIRQKANGTVSHDNVFHTVLGMLDIATTERIPALDLTSGCRR